LPWFLRVGVPRVVVAHLQEVSLPGRTGILTPQPFQVDGTHITTTRSRRKSPIDLF
jgi:hypothetical protein